MGHRRLARQRALQLLYSIEISRNSLTEAIGHYLAFRNELERDPQPIEQFTFDLVEKCLENLDAIDLKLRAALINWKFERLSAIDRNTLRLATTELLFFGDIPPRVTINEYIEVARFFGEDESPQFVNGVLDRVARTEKFDLENTQEKVRISE